jgi:hypothetical protein
MAEQERRTTFCNICGTVYLRGEVHGQPCAPRVGRLFTVQRVPFECAFPDPRPVSYQQEGWRLMRVDISEAGALLTWATSVIMPFRDEEIRRDAEGEFIQ